MRTQRIPVDRSARSYAPGDLPGGATPVGPWPALVGHIVVSLGPLEIHEAGLSPYRVGAGRVADFLTWLIRSASGQRPPRGVLAQRDTPGPFVHWLCTADEGWTLLGAVATAARTKLKEQEAEEAASDLEMTLADGLDPSTTYSVHYVR